MAKVSIGFMRDDGDFQLLATLSNADNAMSEIDFEQEATALAETLQEYYPDEEVTVIEREDVPDTVELELGEMEAAFSFLQEEESDYE